MRFSTLIRDDRQIAGKLAPQASQAAQARSGVFVRYIVGEGVQIVRHPDGGGADRIERFGNTRLAQKCDDGRRAFLSHGFFLSSGFSYPQHFRPHDRSANFKRRRILISVGGPSPTGLNVNGQCSKGGICSRAVGIGAAFGCRFPTIVRAYIYFLLFGIPAPLPNVNFFTVVFRVDLKFNQPVNLGLGKPRFGVSQS